MSTYRYSGIDEAALGPILGPYCCSSVSFSVEEKDELFVRFSSFTDLIIKDSKKLYSPDKGIGELEKTALSFISLQNGSIPENLDQLLEFLLFDKEQIEHIRKIPWFSNLSDLKLPLDNDINDLISIIDKLETFLKTSMIGLNWIHSDVVPAERFNALLKKYNKSEVCQQILSPIIQNEIKDKTRLVVDRQGGRRYYGEWLINLFPGKPLLIRRETKDLSVYEMGDSSIHFQVKGDDLYLETALASIISKYLRELMMICFNRYWLDKVPGIKKTAGYPQDGKRFIKDLNSNKIDYNKEQLIRNK